MRVLICLTLITGCAVPPGTSEPGWGVSGGHLRDRSGRAVILRGVNLSGVNKQKPYLGFHQPADYTRLRAQWGMNAIRFLVTWAAVEPEKGQYDQAYLDQVVRRMDWARQAGLVVVLDMHQDVYGEGFGGDGAPRWTCDEAHYAAFKPVSPWFANYASPEVMACFDRLWTDAELQQRFADAWRQLALGLAGHEAVIGFDVINEPHWGSHDLFSFERDRLAPFYDRVVAAVREVAPHWVAFLEPSASRNLGISTRLSPRPYGDVVYAPHSYDPAAEQGRGFDPSRRGVIVSTIARLADEARMLSAGLWIGEYGGVASDPGIGAYMDAQYDGAAAVAAGSMYWDYNRDEGYGLLGPDGGEKRVLLDVLVRPYPARVAGDPLSFEYDESSRTFTLSYRPSARVVAPTEIVLPRRVYPAGYRVACGGCTIERSVDLVRITHPPASGVARVVVTPP